MTRHFLGSITQSSRSNVRGLTPVSLAAARTVGLLSNAEIARSNNRFV
jgi:hypothetical protein